MTNRRVNRLTKKRECEPRPRKWVKKAAKETKTARGGGGKDQRLRYLCKCSQTAENKSRSAEDGLLQVKEIKKTRTSKILIELKNGAKVEQLKTTVVTALGQGATMRTLDQTVSLVVKELDGVTEETEVTEAIKAAVDEIDRSFIKVKTLRRGFGEPQVAVGRYRRGSRRRH